MRTVLASLSFAALLGACGSADGAGDAGGDRPTIVATTSVMGDVVAELVGDHADVEVLMPTGVDPHDFAPSPQDAVALREAAAVVANGLGLEAGLADALDAAAGDGVTVLAATDYVETEPVDGDHDDGADEHDHDRDAADHEPEDDHAAEEDHEAHDHEGDDPHVFTDPVRMAAVAEGLAADLADAVPELATPEVEAQAAAYVEELRALHDEVTGILADVPEDRRVLVTDHDVLGYFADRYGFEVVGVVIPGGSTLAEPSAAALRDLEARIREAGVPALFVQASSGHAVADALAAEAGGIEVVELHAESLGGAGSGAETYVSMIETNARRIAGALARP